MAQLPNTIEITDLHRPCWYRGNGGLRKAIFHRWVEEKQLVAANLLGDGNPGGCIAATFALIETENGVILKVDPGKIQFADHVEFREFHWGDFYETK